MQIGIIGTGYVGLVSSVCIADEGHTVISVDKKEAIIDSLRSGEVTIFEDQLASKLKSVIEKNTITFTTDFASLSQCQLIFLAVGTPAQLNGHADLTQVFEAIDTLLPIISESTLLAVRSTVPVGTMSKIKEYLISQNRGNQLLGFCPEFLREGVAISDFLTPKYLVFACEREEGNALMQSAYQSIIDKNPEVSVFHCPKFETAELIKYTINSFLATKITFINQIAQLAMQSGADVATVIETIGKDKRIGSEFLIPGPGYGGSCFPKDTSALVNCGMAYGVDLSVVKEVNRANDMHKEYIASWVMETLEELGADYGIKTIAIWGLTFKAGTDDVRDSAAIHIVRSMFYKGGVKIQAYDPKGNSNFNNFVSHSNFSLHNSAIEATQGADALLVLTEWKEFSTIEALEVKKIMKGNAPYVFDTRGVLPMDTYKAAGFATCKFGV